jgi:uncharacterized protein (UPF0335 family)
MVAVVDQDPLYQDAIAIVVNDRKGSVSYLQRRLQLTYNRAAAIMEQMEADGLVGKPNHAGKREILATALPEGGITQISFTSSNGVKVTGTLEQVKAALDQVRGQRPASPPPPGHNSGEKHDGETILNGTAQTQLRTIVERIERLEEDKAGVMADLKEVYAEAKGNGFDTKILRKVVRMRKQDKAKLSEEEALIDLYLSAIGGL